MTWVHVRACASAWLWCAAVLGIGPGARAQTPTVVVEAPPSLASAAARVHAIDWDALDYDLSRAGLIIPHAIHVTLVPEDAPHARDVPGWIVGRAFGSTHLEIFPGRTGRYPYATLESVLRHEVAHLALTRAADDKPLPRWFHEGVATSVEAGWSGTDQVRLTLAALTTPGVSEVSRLFGSQAQPDTSLAYLLAAVLVDDLRARGGRDVPGAIGRRVAQDVPFDQAFIEMTGSTPDEAAARAWGAYRWWTPLLATSASGTAVWAGVLLLAGVAFAVRRVRRAQQRARWDAEERTTAQDGVGDGGLATDGSEGGTEPHRVDDTRSV